MGLAAQAQTASVRDYALSRDIRDRVRKGREEAWQALRLEFEATKTDLLDSVRVATAGTPAEVVGLVLQAVEGVGALGRQLVSVKAEFIKLMNAPSGLEEVRKAKGPVRRSQARSS